MTIRGGGPIEVYTHYDKTKYPLLFLSAFLIFFGLAHSDPHCLPPIHIGVYLCISRVSYHCSKTSYVSFFNLTFNFSNPLSPFYTFFFSVFFSMGILFGQLQVILRTPVVRSEVRSSLLIALASHGLSGNFFA